MYIVAPEVASSTLCAGHDNYKLLTSPSMQREALLADRQRAVLRNGTMIRTTWI